MIRKLWLTRHFTPRPARDIRCVVVHHMTIVGHGNGSALDACYATWQSREASAHFGVDGKKVGQFVRLKDRAWATGDAWGNEHGVSIEHANSLAGPSWRISADTWRTGARLAGQLHRQLGLGRPVRDVTLKRHHDFTSTACPGPYMDSIWHGYVREAQRQFDKGRWRVNRKAAVYDKPGAGRRRVRWAKPGSTFRARDSKVVDGHTMLLTWRRRWIWAGDCSAV